MTEENDICDARSGLLWAVLTISDALARHPGSSLRCIECHGAVRPHKAAINGMRAHFEHLRRHEGCSRGSKFTGTRTKHPDALS